MRKVISISMEENDYEYLKSINLRPTDLVRSMIVKMRENDAKAQQPRE